MIFRCVRSTGVNTQGAIYIDNQAGGRAALSGSLPATVLSPLCSGGTTPLPLFIFIKTLQMRSWAQLITVQSCCTAPLLITTTTSLQAASHKRSGRGHLVTECVHTRRNFTNTLTNTPSDTRTHRCLVTNMEAVFIIHERRCILNVSCNLLVYIYISNVSCVLTRVYLKASSAIYLV